VYVYDIIYRPKASPKVQYLQAKSYGDVALLPSFELSGALEYASAAFEDTFAQKSAIETEASWLLASLRKEASQIEAVYPAGTTLYKLSSAFCEAAVFAVQAESALRDTYIEFFGPDSVDSMPSAWQYQADVSADWWPDATGFTVGCQYACNHLEGLSLHTFNGRTSVSCSSCKCVLLVTNDYAIAIEPLLLSHAEQLKTLSAAVKALTLFKNTVFALLLSWLKSIPKDIAVSQKKFFLSHGARPPKKSVSNGMRLISEGVFQRA
jgi:hypothetical protein